MAQAQKSVPAGRDTATAAIITPRSKQIRNAQKLGGTRINDDFSYLNQEELDSNASNDEIFNANYQKQGLQPTSVQTKRKGTPSANDNQYDGRLTTARYTKREQLMPQNNLARQAQSQRKLNKARLLLARNRATMINYSIFVWSGGTWMTVQLPFALLNLVAFGITLGVNALFQSSNKIVSAAAWLADKVVSGVGSLLGFDINLVQMADDLFLLTYILIFSVGVFTLFTIFLQYTLANLRPLSGQQSGLKLGMLLLAIIGYSVPLLNMFPWAIVWMVAVWKYPK